MYLQLVIVIVSVTLTACLDRQRFQIAPSPDPGFTINQWSGTWYVQARYVPASFVGSVEFTDFVFENFPQKDRVLSPHVWRDRPTGECAGAKFFAYYTDVPGVFKLKDTIGNTYSGDWIVTLLDSKLGLDISWGCTKRDIDGLCSDPWASVKTRFRHPPPGVMMYAEKMLRKMFGLTLAEMELVPQLKGPEDEEEETSNVDTKTDQSETEMDTEEMESDQSEPVFETEEVKEPIKLDETNSSSDKDETPDTEEIDVDDDDEIKNVEVSDKQESDTNDDTQKTDSERNSPSSVEMSPQRKEVMKRLNFPSDLLTLKKVKESELQQTGIPWCISTGAALSKGTSLGPYQGEMVALSSVKPGQLVLQFQTADGDLTFIKVTDDSGAWLSLLKPAELTADHNTKVYFEGSRIWCEVEYDLEANTELVAAFTTNLPADTTEQNGASFTSETEERKSGAKKTETKSQLSPQHVLRYGCPFCGVRFSSPRTLEGHLTYYCSKKPPDFISLQDLQQRLQKQAEQSLALLQKQVENQSRIEQGETSPIVNLRSSPKGQKRSHEEAQIDSSDDTSDNDTPKPKISRQTDNLICDNTADSLIDLQTRMKNQHGNNVPNVSDTERLSVSPQCQDEMFCKECNIQFSSLKTYYGHKEFYCRFSNSKKSKSEEDVEEASTASIRTLLSSDLSPKSIPPGIDPSSLLASSKAVIPPGLFFPGMLQSPFLLQAMSKDLPLLIKNSKSNDIKLSPPAARVAETDQTSKPSDDQPLDLSKSSSSQSKERAELETAKTSPREGNSPSVIKPDPDSPNRSPQPMKLRTVTVQDKVSVGPSPIKTPLNIPTILPTFMANAQTQFVNKKPIPPLQSVSRCVECNIVFYKHENYLIHKEHYCSGRRMKDHAGDSSNSDTDLKSPDSVKKSPDAADLNGKTRSKTNKGDDMDNTNQTKATEVCYKYFCIPCNIKFSSAGTLKAHKEFYCPNGKENDANILIKDKSDKTGEQKYSGSMANYRCEMCKNEFMSARLLKLHICLGEVAAAPLLRCMYCDYVTQTENRLSEHVKVHVPTKAFKCNICGYRGNTARGMRMHGKMHVENGEEFTDDNMIEIEEPPLVPIQRNGACDKGPIDVETELIRMKNEPYKRRRSRKSFEKSENMVPFLSQNMITQICAACGQTFTNVSDFVIHLRMHEIAALEAMKNLKTLKCEHCNDYLADSLTSLLVHMQSKHPEQLPGTSKSESEPVSGSDNERSQSRNSELSDERSRSNSVESSRTSKSSSSHCNHEVRSLNSPHIKVEQSENDHCTKTDPEIKEENPIKKESVDQTCNMNGYKKEETRSYTKHDLDHTNKSHASFSHESRSNDGSQHKHSQISGSPTRCSPRRETSPRQETSPSLGISQGQSTKLSQSPVSGRPHSNSNSPECLISPKLQAIKQEKMSPKQMSPDPKTRYLMSQNLLNMKNEQMSSPIKSPLKTPPPSSPKPNNVSPKLPTIPLGAHSPTLQNLPFIYNPQAMLSLYHLQGGIPSSFNPASVSPTSPGLSSPGDKNGRKYCKHCDINFTYLSSFLTHKKYYCSARNNTEESQSPTATA